MLFTFIARGDQVAFWKLKATLASQQADIEPVKKIKNYLSWEPTEMERKISGRNQSSLTKQTDEQYDMARG